MARISSYPQGTPTTTDNVIGTQVDPITEENTTVQFNIGEINSLSTSTPVNDDVNEKTTSLTNAQWLALNTTSVELVPTQGAGKYIKVLAASVFFNYATTNMDFDSAINIKISGATTSQASLIDLGVTPITANTVYSSGISGGVLPFGSLIISGGGTTSGDGTVQVKIRYQVLDTSAF
tara:strand:- start:1635 stop:2168 length:534 start_codon:yes stop_codon:yes gene_type:complete